MAKLILSTGNIVSGGPSIIRKPGANRSNLELTSSLRHNFLAAQQDYADYDAELNNNNDSNSNNTNGGLNHNDTESHTKQTPAQLPSWTAQEQDGAIYVPRIDWSAAGLQEEPSQYNITVKLFFLPTAPVSRRAQHVAEALDLVLKELRVPDVNLLVVSFPGMSFEGDCEFEADKLNASQGNDDDEAATWPAIEDLHRRGLVKNLGIAEFGSEKLARFIKRVQVRPTVDQINVKNCCNVPPPLVKLAKEQGIELLVHSDCTDILSKGTLRNLLGPGLRGAQVLAGPEESESGGGGGAGLRGDLAPQWVVKYTAVVRDRGVIENKGYFARADLTEE